MEGEYQGPAMGMMRERQGGSVNVMSATTVAMRIA